MNHMTARRSVRSTGTTAIALTVVLALGATAACTHRAPGATAVDPGAGAMSSRNGASDGAGSTSASALPGSAEDLRINVGDRIYFDLDSHQVRADAHARLDAQVAWLQRFPGVSVRIEGNADERGTREYNLALGARRAEAVRAYLVGRGVAAGRIDTISFGKERPIAPGSNEAAFAQNRNAHTAIIESR